jgi:hypothetical protein
MVINFFQKNSEPYLDVLIKYFNRKNLTLKGSLKNKKPHNTG